MGQTLYAKVFDLHKVQTLPSGQTQLFIGLHLINDITSPQGFALLRDKGLGVLYPERSFAVVDHMNPTTTLLRPFRTEIAEIMASEVEKNCAKYGIRYLSPAKGESGIAHLVGPELGLTQPGMTVCCGDSHTSTHGAFGAIAYGIGASQMCDILATQTMAIAKLKVRRIEISGRLGPGVYAKDVSLYLIRKLGVNAGVGFAYEYAGNVIDEMSMEERMTICNLSVEGGARCGYINPDQTTFDYLKGREYAPKAAQWDAAVAYWKSIASDADAVYDDVVRIDAKDIEPTVTWGVNPGQSIPVGGAIPQISDFSEEEQLVARDALAHMQFEPGAVLRGKRIDVAFIGSCTNGRFSDFEEVALKLKAGDFKVAAHVKALIVPGSQRVRRELIEHGYDKVFEAAGFAFREPGCSMCLGMNDDQLVGDQLCASASNRNFKGRQGSATGRTLLMSPVMVAAAAIRGEVADAREVFSIS